MQRTNKRSSILRITIYVLLGLVAICAMLDIFTQPLLWPLALAGIIYLFVDLNAYRFPFLWYLYSHPYRAKRTRKIKRMHRKRHSY